MNLDLFLVAAAGILIFSSSNFWITWVCMEIFLFFLMPWLVEGEMSISKPSSFFYFLSQFLASIGFLIGATTYFNIPCSLLMFISMLMKLACYPLHSWFVKLVPNISWSKIIVLISLSKLPPLVVLTFIPSLKSYMLLLILGLTTPLGAYKSTCLRLLMAYSSVTHSGWMAICSLISKSLSLFYFLMYSCISIPMCILFMKEKLYNLKSTLLLKKGVLQYMITSVTLTGLPPFLGFFPKLLVILFLLQSGSYMESGIMGLMSVIPIFFYLKMSFSSISSKLYLGFDFPQLLSYPKLLLLSGSCLLIMILMLSFSLYMLKH